MGRGFVEPEYVCPYCNDDPEIEERIDKLTNELNENLLLVKNLQADKQTLLYILEHAVNDLETRHYHPQIVVKIIRDQLAQLEKANKTGSFWDEATTDWGMM